MDHDDSQNPLRPPMNFSSGDELEKIPIQLPPDTVAFPAPPSFPSHLSMVFPFQDPLTFSPFIGFDSFESKPGSGAEPGGSGAGGELSAAPQPLGSLYETPIPPFLSKTFDLVDDPSLDAIISWSMKGDSFVVWDPVEFARVILPRNFKHNNFSSFVRQLNTYGFRKIDTDKWEFANEGFVRGQKHLLKTIQRRRSPHSLQVGSSSGSSDGAVIRAALEGEIECLRKERSLMMQEVIELQQQQRGTVQNMEMVNEKLQTAEKRQKQMVSFLGKIFQNPAFLARLQPTREKKSISSPRSMKKFLRHQTHEPGGTSGSSDGTSGAPRKGQIVKLQHELGDPFSAKQLPDLPFAMENVPLQVDDISQGEFAVVQEFLNGPEQAEPVPSLITGDLVFKGKGPAPEYVISFPEDPTKEESSADFSVTGAKSVDLGEGIWSMGFEPGSTELWSDVINYEVPGLGGLSDLWGIGSSLQAAGSLGIEKWPDEDSSFNELEEQEGQTRDDGSKK